MPVTAQSILDRVRTQLIDTGDVQRWSDEELLKWLSDGQRQLVAMVPSASSTTAVQPLVAGTKQTIPANGHMLLNVIRNANGRAMRIVTRELLDGFNPDWHASPATVVATSYTFDPQTPDTFYVYPPNTGTGSVELAYSVLPPELTAMSDNLTVADVYQTPLVDYVMFRAHQKDSDFAAGQNNAQVYLQLFMAAIGQGEAGELSNNPNLQLADPNPGAKGGAK